MRIATLLLCLLPAPALAQKSGWMDIQECPAKHPGPWLTIKDSPEQSKLRKELAASGKIAFASNRDGNWEIYVTNPDGTGQKNLTNHPGWDIGPRWQLETDEANTSEVEVRFVAETPQRTRVELEHRHLDRHGPGWESVRDGVGHDEGWPLYLDRYAALFAEGS